MVRNILGSLLALIGAAAAVLSPFRPWYDGREGSDYPVTDLFNGISGNGSAVVVSVALPFLFAAVVMLFGVVLRSRALVGLAGLAVLGFTVLWMVRQGQSADGLGVSANGTGLGTGIAYAAGGGIVLLLAALVMSGRRHRARRRSPEPQYDYEAPYQQQHPPPYQPPYEQQYQPQYGPPQYESQQYEQPQYQPPYEPRHRHDPYGYQPYAYEPQPPPSSPPEEWSRHDGDTQSLPRVTDEPWSPSSTPPQGPPPEEPPAAPRPR
ncbi:hypothetical protein, partial [Streptomyces scopuliridis]|uniref:Uncharacterized protein n=1 Tax=Streptomyces scopuliridis RB72 TaxID=1440053 RepID=A0A2T7T5H8_9ACTN